jgi:hypothetical protein
MGKNRKQGPHRSAARVGSALGSVVKGSMSSSGGNKGKNFVVVVPKDGTCSLSSQKKNTKKDIKQSDLDGEYRALVERETSALQKKILAATPRRSIVLQPATFCLPRETPLPPTKVLSIIDKMVDEVTDVPIAAMETDRVARCRQYVDPATRNAFGVLTEADEPGAIVFAPASFLLPETFARQSLPGLPAAPAPHAAFHATFGVSNASVPVPTGIDARFQMLRPVRRHKVPGSDSDSDAD